MEQFDALPIECRCIEHMHEGVWLKKKLTKLQLRELGHFFPIRASYCAFMADQLLPQLLMQQFDTLPLQCRCIEHMHEEIWFKKNLTKLQLLELRHFSLISLLYMHR